MKEGKKSEEGKGGKLRKNYISRLFHMVYGTNGPHMVRIVHGTNSQWYEKSSSRRKGGSSLPCEEKNRSRAPWHGRTEEW